MEAQHTQSAPKLTTTDPVLRDLEARVQKQLAMQLANGAISEAEYARIQNKLMAEKANAMKHAVTQARAMRQDIEAVLNPATRKHSESKADPPPTTKPSSKPIIARKSMPNGAPAIPAAASNGNTKGRAKSTSIVGRFNKFMFKTVQKSSAKDTEDDTTNIRADWETIDMEEVQTGDYDCYQELLDRKEYDIFDAREADSDCSSDED